VLDVISLCKQLSNIFVCLSYIYRLSIGKLHEPKKFALELGDDADDIKLVMGKRDGMSLVKRLSGLFQGNFWEEQQGGALFETIKFALRLHGHDAAEWVCKKTLAGTLAYEKKAAKAVLKRFSLFIELLPVSLL